MASSAPPASRLRETESMGNCWGGQLCNREQLSLWEGKAVRGSGWWAWAVEFFSLLNQTEPCSFLAGRRPPSSKYAGKFCLDKHTHSFFKSHRGKRLCADRPTPFQPGRWKPFHEPHNGSSPELADAGPCKVHNFHSVASTYRMSFPSQIQRLEGLFVRHWAWREQGVGRSHEAFFCGLWFPGQLNSVQWLSRGSAR